MKFLDFFRMGLVNLSRRKARTILTALSMAIGVMCIVVLISVGLGYEAAYRENIEAMGSLTKIDVTPPSDSTGGRTALLNDKAVDAFKKLRGVEAVTPVVQATAWLQSGSYIGSAKLYGIEPVYGRELSHLPRRGRNARRGHASKTRDHVHRRYGSVVRGP